MNREEFLINYWQYYKVLEDDFVNVIKYIKLSEENYSTYSDEFAKQLQAIGSEFDVICKQVCECTGIERPNIVDYAKWIFLNNGDIINLTLKVKHQKILEIQPFKDWNKEKPGQLFWWAAYNKVKHNRVNNCMQGNLKNVLNALGALFYMEMYLIKKITQDTEEVDIPNTNSCIFHIKGWSTKNIVLGDGFYVLYENGTLSFKEE